MRVMFIADTEYAMDELEAASTFLRPIIESAVKDALGDEAEVTLEFEQEGFVL